MRAAMVGSRAGGGTFPPSAGGTSRSAQAGELAPPPLRVRRTWYGPRALGVVAEELAVCTTQRKAANWRASSPLVVAEMPPSSCPTDLGWRGKVAIFHLCWHISGLLASQVAVPPSVSAVLGKNLTLECRVDVATNLTLTQSSWERRLPTGSVTVAVYNPRYGISISPEFIHRLYFRSPSSHDATIVLENVGFADTGVYTCKVATFPLGNTQASTTVSVLVEPKVYVSAGSTALIDGSNETAVATCIAERARPPAEVSWESELFGQSEVQLFDDVNGTATTQVRYLWQPTRHVRGRSLTCVVRHPALLNDFRVPYQLNVQFAPDISVAGYDGDWYVGRDDVRMTCKANANPPAHHFRWIRLDGEMPEGVEILNSTLLFLRPLQKNDSGVYRCEVANDIDLRSRDLRILIQEHSEAERSNSIAVAGAAIGTVLALFLIAVFVVVLITARKAPPAAAFSDKVIDLPPTHKPPPPYSERAPAVPVGVHASQVAWLCQSRGAERSYDAAERRRPPGAGPQSPTRGSRLEWVCHQSGTERVYINHREHYV
ncbi:nectin-3-like protein isoform X3 [Phyllopteryx taeniolatus]|uniref:nectin-3-like protein isoform X3 n=1 Tax=Phyllopteryx taeniolatus TaxID=161469 RepID=UPI002AD4B81D|nr:nectin-3-like protein isoform X3 [Phyllopteryx taeniolatus]